MIVRNLQIGATQHYNGATVRIVGLEAARDKDTFDVTLAVDGKPGHKTLLGLSGAMEFQCNEVEWILPRRRKRKTVLALAIVPWQKTAPQNGKPALNRPAPGEPAQPETSVHYRPA